MKYSQKQQALGSIIELCIVSSQPQADIDTLYDHLWHRIFAFEKQCSRFLPASELSFFNRRAGIKHTVSPSFRQVLIAAKSIGLRSEGLYNPFILPALQAAGYSPIRLSLATKKIRLTTIRIDASSRLMNLKLVTIGLAYRMALPLILAAAAKVILATSWQI